jgi:hypothetical protein
MSDDTIIEHSYLSLVNDIFIVCKLCLSTSIILVIDVFIHDFLYPSKPRHGHTLVI